MAERETTRFSFTVHQNRRFSKVEIESPGTTVPGDGGRFTRTVICMSVDIQFTRIEGFRRSRLNLRGQQSPEMAGDSPELYVHGHTVHQNRRVSKVEIESPGTTVPGDGGRFTRTVCPWTYSSPESKGFEESFTRIVHQNVGYTS